MQTIRGLGHPPCQRPGAVAPLLPGVAALVLLAACQPSPPAVTSTPPPGATAPSAATSPPAASALPSALTLPSAHATGWVSADAMLSHIRILSADAMEGRLPATHGEQLAIEYIAAQLKALGARPGNPDGSYFQSVPLVGMSATAQLTLNAGGKTVALAPGTDFVATTARFEPQVTIKDSPLVFVGYGVQAPEYHWDDYKGLDLRGKTLLMLINDPPVSVPGHPEQLDEQMFKGKAMTYYGRWTYKYEIASRLQAAAVLIIHETEPAGYGWNVVQHSWSGEQFRLDDRRAAGEKVGLEGWITLEKARELLQDAGQDFAALKAAAVKPDFRPVPLEARLSASIDNRMRSVQSHNVVGLIPGSDARLAGEYVIYTAHWDHLGRDPKLKGDQIFNGAVDNASGVAGLLEIGHAFSGGEPKPRRSIVLMAVTAEEQGLLGSEFYARHPLYPLEKTLANINMDSVNVYGRSRDFQIIGSGQNTLEEEVAALIRRDGRVLTSDAEPEKGRYFRSDQFNFAKVGVPALYTKGGLEILGKPAGYGKQKQDEFTAKCYHNTCDEIAADWDLSGAAEDMLLLYHVGLDVANGSDWPSWRADSEFRQARESSLRSTAAPPR